MDDSDTATVELTKSEAREVINALSSYRTAAAGRDEQRARNVEELLQREFGFEERHLEDDRSIVETFAEVFENRDGEHEIELSRSEATEVVAALDEFEGSPSEDAETVADLRDRFEATFDLDTPATS